MTAPYHILIIGGGINGTAIARDAAGRGLSVLLVEKDDLASHTSSASSKLIHGGLRYLEQFEFRLVHEALNEREILLRTAPHIVTPLRFVLPLDAGRKPWWMVRAGLYLYDLLAGKDSLPRSRTVHEDKLATPLKPKARRHLAAYWDAWVDDARLVVLNAVDAAERGAEIATRTALVSAHRENEVWRARLSDGRTLSAKAIVNAAGPWVKEVLGDRLQSGSKAGLRLIRGSHIVVPQLHGGDHAYILIQPDGRVIFALPYQGRFTLIGTTDAPVENPDDARISDGEIRYLCDAANRSFERQIEPEDVVSHYAGIRALYDDGTADAQAVTRDYRLELEGDGAPLLSLFGGKITTARALAEEALEELGHGGAWTKDSPLPGGDFERLDQIMSNWPWLPDGLRARLASAYGTRMTRVIGDAASVDGLGRHFGAGLYEAEVDYLMREEFALTAKDILSRRTKIGLFMSAGERAELDRFLKARSVTPA